MEKIYAPWTDAQIGALNYFQQANRIRPSTCDQGHTLVASRTGWFCPADGCGYLQNWAHAFMADTQLLPVNLNSTNRKISPNSIAEAIAFRIRAELVCCDIYGRVARKELTFDEARNSRDWHDLCYWGEASAQIAEGRCPGYETEPNICRCPCEGCKHNCSAHQNTQTGDDDAQKDTDPASVQRPAPRRQRR
jgi:hypothetical protein